MNKTELIAAVAEKASISKKESEVVINAALDTIIDSLKNDEKVQLVGFGSFETKHRAERTGRNPKTKESITIAASKVPTFKAGKAFKDTLTLDIVGIHDTFLYFLIGTEHTALF